MTPTNKLRFVDRSEPMHPFYKAVAHDGSLIEAKHHYRVLQQWWEDVDFLPGTGEWRDIEVVQDEDTKPTSI